MRAPGESGGGQIMLTAGDPAPDVVLEATGGQQVRLSEFRGRCNVLLAFYRLDWTST